MHGPWMYHMCQAHNLIRSHHNSWLDRKTVWKSTADPLRLEEKVSSDFSTFEWSECTLKKKSLSQEYIPPLTTQNSRTRTSASLLRNMHDMGCLFTFYTPPFIDLYILLCIFSYLFFSCSKINFMTIFHFLPIYRVLCLEFSFLVFFVFKINFMTIFHFLPIYRV